MPQAVDIQAPDGRTYRFPEGTTPDKADAYFKAKGIRGRAQETVVPPEESGSTAINRILAPSDMRGNDPNTLPGYAKTWGEAAKGAAAGIKGLLTPSLPAKVNWNPVTQVKEDVSKVKDFLSTAKENPNYAAGEVAGPMLLTHTLSKLMAPAGMAAKLTRGAGGMSEDIEPTIADLRAVTREVNPDTGKPFGTPSTVGDFVKQVSAAESKLNNEYANALGPHANEPGPTMVDGRFPVAEAIRKLKDKIGDTTPQDKAARAYIDQMASHFQKPLSLGELNKQRIAANARLYSFENKSDVAQYAAAGANTGTAVDKAIANSVRDEVYPMMDFVTGKPPGYFRNLQSRVGHLFRLESDAKEYATKVHQKTMESRGSTPMERLRPGGAVSAGGGIHGYISNIPQLFKAADPEGKANAAVRSAYSLRQKVQPPPEAMSLPLSSLLGAFNQPKKRVAAALAP